MKRTLPLHAFLLAVFPVLFLFTHNINELYGAAGSFLPLWLAISLSLAIITFSMTWLMAKKDLLRAGVITSLLLFIFFSYGYFFDFLKGILGADIIRHRYVIPATVGLTLFSVISLFRIERSLRGLTRYLNMFASVLLLFSLFSIVRFSVAQKPVGELLSLLDADEVTLDEIQPSESLPDIYYIVLDGYARASVLESFHDFNNEEFLGFLRERGFFVADESTSNYNSTYESLASSLNMSYLDPIIDYIGRDSNDLNALGYAIENNHVIRLLDEQGYEYIHFSSGYPMTNFNKNADIFYREGMDRFSLFLLNSTILRPVFDPTSPWRVGFSKDDEIRRRILFTFNTLRSLPARKSEESPRFVFAHIVSPHHPYVFDSEGHPIKSKKKSGYTPEEAMQRYKEQLVFINAQVEDVVDTILVRSELPPIVIIQSDHGAQPPTAIEMDDLYRYYRFHNLIAVHTADNEQYEFYGTMTPVNVFRAVLSGLFSADLSLLEDRLYRAEKERFDFVDITPDVSSN